MDPLLPEIVIPPDKAVFRMDAQGRWHNDHGPFEHPKIIAYFNAHIRRDAEGYYLCQELNGRIEKVYFPYEDTALFAVDIIGEGLQEMLLNTGECLCLRPDKLVMRGEDLYQVRGDERIKFTERCLLKLVDHIQEREGAFFFVTADTRHLIVALDGEDG